MSNTNLKLDLHSRLDKNGKVYYVAKLLGPFTIDCTNGVVFLVYTSEIDHEELQIAAIDERGDENR